MADQLQKYDASFTKLVGSDSTGLETNPVKSSVNGEISNVDTCNYGGLDKVLTVGTSAVELKVGASRKTTRKIVAFEALSNNIKWGFSNTTQSFDVFKNQLIVLPVGEDTEIWFIAGTAGQSVAIGEL